MLRLTGRLYSTRRISENIFTVPNALTVSRLFMTPFIGSAIVNADYPLALALLTTAGVTDLLDGYVARRWNQKTFIGSALDPFADKLLMTVVTGSLCYSQLLPVPLGSLIIGRDLGLVAGTAYYRYVSLKPPVTLKRYFDVSLPSAEVRPPLISKVNTLLQLTLMAASVACPMLQIDTHHPAMTVLQILVATTTVWSGIHFALARDTIRILK